MFFDNIFKFGRQQKSPNDEGKSLSKKADYPPRNIGRNDPCACGSGKKYKKCCLKEQKESNPIIGYVAVDRKIGNLFCSGQDAIVAGSEDALKQYLSNYPTTWKPTIEPAYYKQMKTVLELGGTYVLDMEAYQKWTAMIKEEDIPGMTINNRRKEKIVKKSGIFAPPGGCCRIIGKFFKTT